MEPVRTEAPVGRMAPSRQAVSARRAVTRHVLLAWLALFAVFTFRWALAEEFVQAPVVGGILTVILVFVGLAVAARLAPLRRAVRQAVALAALAGTLVLVAFGPLPHEVDRVFDGIPVVEVDQRVKSYSPDMLCSDNCFAGRTYTLSGEWQDAVGTERGLLQEAGWAITSDSRVTGDEACLERLERCSLEAAKGRMQLSLAFVPGTGGGPGQMGMTLWIR